MMSGGGEERLEVCLEQISARDVKTRVEGAGKLLALATEGSYEDEGGGSGSGSGSRGGVPRGSVAAATDALLPLTRDNNPKAASIACQCLGELAMRHGDVMRQHPTPLVAAADHALDPHCPYRPPAQPSELRIPRRRQ